MQNAVIKEPVISLQSPMAEFLKGYKEIRSLIYLSHVRQSTSTVSYANTHPFVRELRGREYIFAHNGMLQGNYKSELSTGRWTPVGTTDSEYAFCHLMDTIENQINNWDEESFFTLAETMKHINSFGNFNCLLSDGEYLFCYRDKNGHKGLCYTHRKFPFQNAKLMDEDFEILLDHKKDPGEAGYIIATKALTSGEEWVNCEKGCLMVFRKGVQIFPEKQEITEEQLMRALRFIRSEPQRTDVFMISNAIGIKIKAVAPLIQALCDRGYVRQDSRDTAGPYDPNATYYTVPAKRDEIDSLLKEDEERCIASYSDLNCKEAAADDRTPTCTKCRLVYKNGTRYCRKCNSDLELFDTRILDIISLLNKDGYPTVACCSGHVDGEFRQYLIFKNNIGEVRPPDGFTIRTYHGVTELHSIEYYKAKGITSKKMRDKITLQDLEQFAKENMNNLRKWAHLLCEKNL